MLITYHIKSYPIYYTSNLQIVITNYWICQITSITICFRPQSKKTTYNNICVNMSDNDVATTNLTWRCTLS